jgi:hypothetical protein
MASMNKIDVEEDGVQQEDAGGSDTGSQKQNPCKLITGLDFFSSTRKTQTRDEIKDLVSYNG